MGDFFMDFTELWLSGVLDIAKQISDFFFDGVIGNVLIGVLVFSVFAIYILRPATHAYSDTVLTRGIAAYQKREPSIDGDKVLGDWYAYKESTASPDEWVSMHFRK